MPSVPNSPLVSQTVWITNENELYNLTRQQVQEGDIVMTRIGRKGWLVVDNDHIGDADGFKELESPGDLVSDGKSIRRTITAAQSFVDGDVVYNNAGTWTKAQADNAATAQGLWYVQNAEVGSFEVARGTVVTPVGLAAGTYFLSAATAGAVTATAPSNAAHYVVPCLVVEASTVGTFWPPAFPSSNALIASTDIDASLADWWVVPLGDETTAITTGTGKRIFRAPYAGTLLAVRGSLANASSSGAPAFDLNKNGVSMLSTTLTIDANEKTSTTATTAAVISTTAIADDDELSIDIDTAGTGAAGAKIYLKVQRS